MNDFLLYERLKKLQEALRLKELNMELLDTLSAIIHWLYRYTEKHNIPFEEERDSLRLLLTRASSLIEEITSPPPKLQHRFRTPEDTTEPLFLIRY